LKVRFPRTLVILALSALAGPVRAEDETPPGPWSFGAIVGLNLSQSAFSNNWAGGDQGSITWALKSDLKAERQLNESFHWSNTLQLAFGQTAKQATTASGKKRWDTPDKTTDLIQFESLARFTLHKWVDPYVGGRLDSQFLDQSDAFDRTLTFNPVRLKETAGLARVFEKTETTELISRVGFGFRQTLAKSFTDDTGATDGTESVTTNDGGFEFQTNATYPLAGGKIQYKGEILVFLPLFYSQSDELEEYDALALAADASHEAVADFWKSPDVNFQNTFDAKLTSWLSVNLYAQLIYDKFDASTEVDPMLPLAGVDSKVRSGIRKSGQFKQTLALALSYRFL
jgi:hypothetical protein